MLLQIAAFAGTANHLPSYDDVLYTVIVLFILISILNSVHKGVRQGQMFALAIDFRSTGCPLGSC